MPIGKHYLDMHAEHFLQTLRTEPGIIITALSSSSCHGSPDTAAQTVSALHACMSEQALQAIQGRGLTWVTGGQVNEPVQPARLYGVLGQGPHIDAVPDTGITSCKELGRLLHLLV